MEDLEERLLFYWGPDFGPVTPLFPIDQAVSGPAVAADAQGNFVIVWTRQGTTSNSIMGRRFNPFGVPLSDKFEVVSGLNVDHAALAMDPAGDFAVTWQDGEIRARLFSAGGLPRSTPFLVNTYTPGVQEAPVIAMDGDGDFAIAWTSQEPGEVTARIFAQRFTAAGERMGEAVSVSAAVAGDNREPHIAMDEAGDFAVAWTREFQRPGGILDADIYARQFAVNSGPSPEFRVNVAGNGFQHHPALNMSRYGDIGVAWVSLNPSDAGVFFRQFAATGQPSSSEKKLSVDTPDLLAMPRSDPSLGTVDWVAWYFHGILQISYGGFPDLVKELPSAPSSIALAWRPTQAGLILAWDGDPEFTGSFQVRGQRFAAADSIPAPTNYIYLNQFGDNDDHPSVDVNISTPYETDTYQFIPSNTFAQPWGLITFIARADPLMGLQPVVALYDRTSHRILYMAQWSDTPGTAVMTVPWGSYWVAVSSGDGTTGDVSLSISSDNVATPTVVSPSPSGTGTAAGSTSSTSYYSFTVPSDATGGMRVTVTPASLGGPATLDAAVYLLDSFGYELAKADAGAVGFPETINYPAAKPGDIFVVAVVQKAFDTAGPFSISFFAPTPTPPAPSTPDLDAASDTGVRNDDNITYASTLLLRGTAAPGTFVRLFDDTQQIATVNADGQGRYAFNLTGLPPGLHLFRVTAAISSSSTQSESSDALRVMVDREGPNCIASDLLLSSSYAPTLRFGFDEPVAPAAGTDWIQVQDRNTNLYFPQNTIRTAYDPSTMQVSASFLYPQGWPPGGIISAAPVLDVTDVAGNKLSEVREMRFAYAVSANVTSAALVPTDLDAIIVAGTGRFAFLSGAKQSFHTDRLTIAGRGVLDIADGILLVRDGNLDDITNLVSTARNALSGRWSGPGITSSLAAESTDKGLAIAQLGSDVKVKFTWNGDLNLDGRVNADDYFFIDQGFLTEPPLPTYHDGDFNFDTKINADDYFLIDQAFLNQKGITLSTPKPALSTTLRRSVAPSLRGPFSRNAIRHRIHKAHRT